MREVLMGFTFGRAGAGEEIRQRRFVCERERERKREREPVGVCV